jgi:hypothetical protein
MSRPAMEPTQPPITRYRDSVPEIKRPWHEADHSPQSDAEVGNDRNYSFTSPRLYGMYRDKFSREISETGAF